MALWKRAKNQDEVADTSDAGSVEEVIDLRDEPASSAPGFGCPDCGGHGFLDHIDLRKGVQHLHCRACDARWTTTEALPTSS